MSNFRIMLLSTAAVGLVGALASPASAGEVEKSASFGGHVNRTLTILDDGDSTDLMSGDNGASMSRIRFQGSATSEDLTAKAYIEVRARGNRSNNNARTTATVTDSGGDTITATSGTGASGTSLSMRHSYVSLSNNAGTLVLGDTNPAGDLNGWGSGNFNGAWQGVDGDTLNGGEFGRFLVNGSGATTGQEESVLASVAPLHTMSSGRGGVVRYDSPDFNGFSFSAGIKGGSDAAEESSVSLGYSADFDGTKVAFGYGFTNTAGSNATYDNFHSVGGGVELASGINAHVGYFKKNNQASGSVIDPTMWTVDVGYNMSVVDAGTTSINVNYSQQDDGLTVNDDLTWYGLNVNQELSDYGTSLYGGISHAEYSISGNATTYEDLTAGWVGVRVTF